MIEVTGLGVARGANAVLHDVSLAVAPAELVVVAGPSGAGKSTLLRAIAGLQPILRGTVRLGDQLVEDAGRRRVEPEDRNVAMVFQDLALWPHRTVGGNVAFALETRGLARAERDRRVAEALGWVGLAGTEHRRPGSLSGGERQRVALARALAQDPVALLLDEPLSGVDILLAADLVALVRRLVRERRVPTLLVTHDPHVAAALADRIVLLEAGRVTAEGKPSDLVGLARTPFARAFAGAMVRHGEEPRAPEEDSD